MATLGDKVRRVNPDEFYLRLSKHLIRELGYRDTIVLQTLIDFKEELDKDRYLNWKSDDFFYHYEWLMQDLGVSAPVAIGCFKRLERLGYMTCEYKGEPRRRFIKLNYDKIIGVMEDPSFSLPDRLGKYREVKKEQDEIEEMKKEYQRYLGMDG